VPAGSVGRVVRAQLDTGAGEIVAAIEDQPGPVTGGQARSRSVGAARTASTPVLVALALLAFVASAAAVMIRWSGELHPISDIALTEIAVRDVGHHAVLVGPYSRFGWNHPGPILFYLLAAPYRALGSGSAALYAAAALVNGAMAALVVGVCARRGGPALGWWSLLAVGVYSWALGPAVLRYPWNPYVTVMALAALTVVVWTLIAGDSWALPVTFGLATFLVQSHVGYLPISAVLVLVGVGGLAARAWHDHRAGLAVGRPIGPAVVVTVVVLGVLWAPPVYQQLTRDPGNLGELRLYFAHHSGDHTVADGLDAVVPYLGVVPHQLAARAGGAATGPAAPGWATATTVAALVLAAAAAAWRRAWDGARLVGLVAVSVPVAVVSAARVTGAIYSYLVLWASAIGLVAWIAAGAVAVEIARSRSPLRPVVGRVAVATLAATVAAAVVVTATNTAGAVRVSAPDGGAQPVAARVSERVLAAARRREGRGPVLVRLGDRESWVLGAGAVLALDRRGIPVKVDPQFKFLFGERLAGDHRPESAVITLTVRGTPADERERDRPGHRLVGGVVSPDTGRTVDFYVSPGRPTG